MLDVDVAANLSQGLDVQRVCVFRSLWVTVWSGGLDLACALQIYVQTSWLHRDPDETLSRPREVQMGNAAA